MKITVEYDDWTTHTSYSFSKALFKHLDQLADRGITYKYPYGSGKGFTKKQLKAVLKHLDTKVETI